MSIYLMVKTLTVQAVYIKSFFYIGIIAMAKISTLRTLRELTPQASHRLLVRCIKTLIGVCAVTSQIALGLQCALPNPWDFRTGKCLDRAALAVFVFLWDVLTDVAIVLMPFLILRTLNITKLARQCCLAAFGTRLL